MTKRISCSFVLLDLGQEKALALSVAKELRRPDRLLIGLINPLMTPKPRRLLPPCRKRDPRHAKERPSPFSAIQGGVGTTTLAVNTALAPAAVGQGLRLQRQLLRQAPATGRISDHLMRRDIALQNETGRGNRTEREYTVFGNGRSAREAIPQSFMEVWGRWLLYEGSRQDLRRELLRQAGVHSSSSSQPASSPEVIAQEIADDLQAAFKQFAGLPKTFGRGRVFDRRCVSLSGLGLFLASFDLPVSTLDLTLSSLELNSARSDLKFSSPEAPSSSPELTPSSRELTPSSPELTPSRPELTSMP